MFSVSASPVEVSIQRLPLVAHGLYVHFVDDGAAIPPPEFPETLRLFHQVKVERAAKVSGVSPGLW